MAKDETTSKRAGQVVALTPSNNIDIAYSSVLGPIDLQIVSSTGEINQPVR